MLLTTTIWKDEYENQNEVVVISGVSPNGLTLTLTKPLRFYNHG